MAIKLSAVIGVIAETALSGNVEALISIVSVDIDIVRPARAKYRLPINGIAASRNSASTPVASAARISRRSDSAYVIASLLRYDSSYGRSAE
jgi:hypothetical protein